MSESRMMTTCMSPVWVCVVSFILCWQQHYGGCMKCRGLREGSEYILLSVLVTPGRGNRVRGHRLLSPACFLRIHFYNAVFCHDKESWLGIMHIHTLILARTVQRTSEAAWACRPVQTSGYCSEVCEHMHTLIQARTLQSSSLSLPHSTSCGHRGGLRWGDKTMSLLQQSPTKEAIFCKRDL